MSSSFRRRDISPQSRSGKLRMDRQPVVARITDPSLAAGKRKEIDNVMKKARATSTNNYWDKKLLEAEEKDPNRWRHTGYKKMYIEGDSSSESEREGNFRYNNNRGGGNVGGNMNNGGGSGYRANGPSGGRPMIGGPPIVGRSRSRSPPRNFVSRKTPPLSPPMRRRSPPDHNLRRGMVDSRRIPRSPDMGPGPRGRIGGGGPRGAGSPILRGGNRSPRSPPPMGGGGGGGARRGGGGIGGNKSPIDSRRRSPMGMPPNKRAAILPRSKRPPSPPPKSRPSCHSRSNSSVSSCSDDSCSVCSPKHHRPRSHSSSIPPRSRQGGPRSPPLKSMGHHSNRGAPISHSRAPHHHQSISGKRPIQPTIMPSSSNRRPASPPPPGRADKYRVEEKISRGSRERSRDLLMERPPPEPNAKSRSNRHTSPPADPRLKIRPPEPPEPAPLPKKKKDKNGEKQLRTKIKIEGEKRKKQHNSSSDSDDSESDSEGSLPTFTATTRLTLSERFGKMAQWSVDRSNMENMRITKDSTGGALKVMIEEGLESPPQRFSYSPAPAGHFPEELATTAPSGMLSWDDVRVRFEYYKSRGYLRDLDLKDYIKWEEWWYRYQEWLKQERYYEFWERQQMHRRRRKKIPISQRLN